MPTLMLTPEQTAMQDFVKSQGYWVKLPITNSNSSVQPSTISSSLKKYVFLRDYLATRTTAKDGSVQTLEAVAPKQFKKGDVVDGVERTIDGDTYVRIGNYFDVLFASPIAKFETILSEVKNEPTPIDNKKQKTTDEANKEAKPKQPLFTTKNIIIAVVVVGSILGILKWKKVI